MVSFTKKLAIELNFVASDCEHKPHRRVAKKLSHYMSPSHTLGPRKYAHKSVKTPSLVFSFAWCRTNSLKIKRLGHTER